MLTLDAAELFLVAVLRNDMISINPDGIAQIHVPHALQSSISSELYDEEDPTHITLTHLVDFAYRKVEWDLRVRDNKRVTYEFTFDPLANMLGKWYVTASWSYDENMLIQPPLETLRQFRTLGVDMNADHVACWVVDQ